MSKELPGWKDMVPGGIVLEPGSSESNNTGSWRTYVPVTDYEKCIHCLRCWIMCPDSSIIIEDAKKTGTNLFHCKGCGICAQVCPVDCIEMKLEAQMGEDEQKG